MPLPAVLLIAAWSTAAAAAPAETAAITCTDQATCPASTAAEVRSQAPALLQVDASKTGGGEFVKRIADSSPDASTMASEHVWQIDDATPEKAELSMATKKAGNKFTLLCYNVLYTNFHRGSKVDEVAQVVMEMGSDVAGLQECMNIGTMQKSFDNKGGHMRMAQGSDWPNCIFFRPAAGIRLGEHGRRYLNSDNYSERFVSYAQLFHHGKEFWLFNTHWCLHGPCGGARGGQMHRQAAEIMTNLRRELGAGSKPAVITGDLNSHMDGYDNDAGVQWLLNHGFQIAAKGPTYGGIDYILTSRNDWDVSNFVEREWDNPSDHAPFAVDLALRGC